MPAALSTIARRLPALAFAFFLIKGLAWLVLAVVALASPLLV